MYNSYFGFREKPFKLVPNPEYLFLSKTHEIALAHLTYATDQGEGFVVIIGEVGTGKTTLCRNYLESLDEVYDSAYIFNPHLDSNELLAGICHEYGIRTEEKSTKALLDILNEFLIRQNTDDRKVVLLIDEAQLLSVENLEMVRMLSNLETTKSKLLQIILVGQPELAEKLETYELRQLSQRISLNYHLTPLPREDTEAYIQHRIGIASQRQDKIFTSNACRLAHRFSNGIPRLINVVCDRALLTAYSQNKSRVTRAIMQEAIAELSTSSEKKTASKRRLLIWWGAGGVAVLAMVVVGALMLLRYAGDTPIHSDGGQTAAQNWASPNTSPAKPFKVPVTPEKAPNSPQAQGTEKTAIAETAGVSDHSSVNPTDRSKVTEISNANMNHDVPVVKIDGDADVDRLVAGLETFSSRKNSAAMLLSIWELSRPNVDLIPEEVDDKSFFDIAAKQYGLRNYSVPGNWDIVERIDLPAIISLKSSESDQRVYLSLVGWRDGKLQLMDRLDGQRFEVKFDSLRPYLDGPVNIFWKNLIGFDMIIGYGSDDRAVLMVKNLLRKIGYGQIMLTPEFDADTRRAIRHFQAGHQLGVDGLVGPLTKIMLLREAGTAKMPQLNSGIRVES